MKKGIAGLCAFLLVLGLGVPAFAQDKIGYVDLAKLFDEYKKTKDFDKELEGLVSQYDKERESKVSEIKGLQDKLNILSDEEKKNKQKDFENKVKEVRDFTISKEGEIRKQRDERFKEVFDDIDAAIKEYAPQAGYTLVFNDKVLAYNDGKNDITAEVSKILQSKYSK